MHGQYKTQPLSSHFNSSAKVRQVWSKIGESTHITIRICNVCCLTAIAVHLISHNALASDCFFFFGFRVKRAEKQAYSFCCTGGSKSRVSVARAGMYRDRYKVACLIRLRVHLFCSGSCSYQQSFIPYFTVKYPRQSQYYIMCHSGDYKKPTYSYRKLIGIIP